MYVNSSEPRTPLWDNTHGFPLCKQNNAEGQTKPNFQTPCQHRCDSMSFYISIYIRAGLSPKPWHVEKASILECPPKPTQLYDRVHFGMYTGGYRSSICYGRLRIDDLQLLWFPGACFASFASKPPALPYFYTHSSLDYWDCHKTAPGCRRHIVGLLP